MNDLLRQNKCLFYLLLVITFFGCAENTTVYVLTEKDVANPVFHPIPDPYFGTCSHVLKRGEKSYRKVRRGDVETLGYIQCSEYHLHSGWQSHGGTINGHIHIRD